MNKDLLGITLLSIIIICIIFVMFIYNAIINLADDTKSTSYKKSNYIRGIGFWCLWCFFSYILYQLSNILILNL